MSEISRIIFVFRGDNKLQIIFRSRAHIFTNYTRT